jgi:cobaltochelatase CobN
LVKIALVMLAYEIEPVMLAVKNIKEKLNVDIEVCPRTTQDLLDSNNLTNFISFAQTSNAVIVHIMGGRTNFPGFDQAIAPLRGFHVPVFTADIQSDPEVMAASTLDKNDYQTIYQYLKNGCVENFENLILFLANRFAGGNFELSPPKAMLIEGIYHPKLGNVPTLSEYIEKNSMSKELTVGILFNDPLKTNDVAFADSLIESIESQGANALMVFLSSTDPSAKNLKWVFENYFMKNGKPVVDVVISTLAHSLAVFMPNSEPATNLFKELNVPVLKAIATYNTFEQWRDSMLGLTYSEVAWNVAMPEFDGLIITVPIAARWLSETDPITGSKITLNKPIPERLEKLVRLSINWAKLRHIPNSEKKVAIIFHNYPPKNDTIGHAAGLDSAASVMNLLRDFQKQGYTLEGLPENGQKLMAEVINGLTNDRRWLSADELSERAIDKIPKEQYTHWFSELPVEPQEMILKHWGKPPGAIFNYKSNLLVPGILNGNVFIGMQPPRGKLEDPAAIYHDPVIPIPHHYVAYYRWIRDMFKANVIIHVGKHGSLEWLPGKSVGLSASCFPDITISDLPHIYLYLIDDPGEGTQAKRRSYCCLIDYLIPVMHNAGSYDDLAKITVQLKQYYYAKSTDPGKLTVLQKLIWEATVKANLNRDLKISEEEAFADFDGFLEHLHAYLNELSDTHKYNNSAVFSLIKVLYTWYLCFI